MSFVTNPRSGKIIQNGIKVFIIIFIGVVLISWRKRSQQSRSSFKTWQRMTSMPIVFIFFLVSCQTGSQSTRQNRSDGEITYKGDSGNLVTIMSLDIDSSTADGIPIGTYYYHTDHLGSSKVITDEDGIEISRFAYNLFGDLVQKRSWGENVVTHKFTSQELDEESNLMYYNARFYDPQIGRLLTADIIISNLLEAQHFNRYSYVVNNPVSYTDPSGHKVVTVIEGGTVWRAGWQKKDHKLGLGYRISISTPDGCFNNFGHLDPEDHLKVGDKPKTGDYAGRADLILIFRNGVQIRKQRNLKK